MRLLETSNDPCLIVKAIAIKFKLTGRTDFYIPNTGIYVYMYILLFFFVEYLLILNNVRELQTVVRISVAVEADFVVFQPELDVPWGERI